MNPCKYCGENFEGRRMSGHVTGCQSNPNRYWIRPSEEQKKARNKAKVYAYRARKYSAILPTSDMELIRKIYEACPEGYEVDHKIALASGGSHHQDNLQYLPIRVNRSKQHRNQYDESVAIQWKDILL